jgi:hypothetical protein
MRSQLNRLSVMTTKKSLISHRLLVVKSRTVLCWGLTVGNPEVLTVHGFLAEDT